MLKPLVTQVWPQFTADEQFTASFSNVFVERVELFRSARKVIICLRSTEPLDSALCGRLLASLEQIFAGYELTMRKLRQASVPCSIQSGLPDCRRRPDSQPD